MWYYILWSPLKKQLDSYSYFMLAQVNNQILSSTPHPSYTCNILRYSIVKSYEIIDQLMKSYDTGNVQLLIYSGRLTGGRFAR